MLDLSRVAAQIGEATARERERQARATEETNTAAELLRAQDAPNWAAQVQRIRAAEVAFQMAHCIDLPATAVSPQPPPATHVVVASDGSQVAPDRHEGLGGCYLLNASKIFLSYGTGARAQLGAKAIVRTLEPEEDSDEDGGRAAAELSMRRFAFEMETLSELIADAAASGLPALAITDGSLIAWHLYDKEGKEPNKAAALAALKAALAKARECRVPLAGYISRPGGCDIAHALRVMLCPEETVLCHRCRMRSVGADTPAPPCRAVSRTTDAALFKTLLGPGQRSAVFTTGGQASGYSKILERYEACDRVHFFYLNVIREVARVEIPAWVAEDPDLLERVHAIVFDQACKGPGYPVALAEAHEQAVVRGADREAFLNQMRRSFVGAGLPIAVTRKALAKQMRAV